MFKFILSQKIRSAILVSAIAFASGMPHAAQAALASNEPGLTVAPQFFSSPVTKQSPAPLLLSGEATMMPDPSLTQDGEQKMSAMIIDGAYDFDYDPKEALGFAPYIRGSFGLGVVGPSVSEGAALQKGDTVPLFRLGGGINYHLGPQWNLALDYQASFAGAPHPSDMPFTSRGQVTDSQRLDMGLKLKF